MHKAKLPLSLVAIILILAFSLSSTTVQATSPACKIIKQNTAGEEFDNLQAAVDAVTSGDALLLKGYCVGTTIIDKNLTIVGISTPSSGPATLDGAQAGSVLTINGEVIVIINGLTVTGGHSGFDPGGGIDNGGILTLTDSIINDNVSRGGGAGIYNNGVLKMYTSVVSDNSDNTNFGGGIYSDGVLEMYDSVVHGNFAAGAAGGIYNDRDATMVLNDSVVSDNETPRDGGGIFNHVDATLELNDSTISGNHANVANTDDVTGGGGILNWGILDVNNSTIRDNTVGVSFGSRGGGISNYAGGTTTLNNSTVSNNTAGRHGGGIYNGFTYYDIASTVILNNSVVNDNTVASGYDFSTGGGIYSNSLLEINDSTISGNVTASDGGGIYNRGLMTMNNSLVTDNISGFPEGGRQGGGIYHARHTATINGSIISNNTTGFQGGGLYIATGTVEINDSTISENTVSDVSGNGGGVFNNNGTLNLSNITFFDNAPNDCVGLGCP